MKKYYSNIAKAAFVQAWQDSQQSQTVFCREQQISKSALFNWRKKFGQQIASSITTANNPYAAIKFLPIKKPIADPCPANDNLIEIKLPNGCQLKTSLVATNFKLLLQELLQWK